MRNILKTSLFFSVAFGSSFVFASPEGGVVADGKITITKDSKTTQITQTTQNGIIDWTSFNVKADEKVNFNQPNPYATTLNRINDVNPSSIDGQITANGEVVLINPNGIFFGKNSKIDVAKLIASTVNLDADMLLNSGELISTQEGLKADAFVINDGDIFIGQDGSAVLISTHLRNSGNIHLDSSAMAVFVGADTIDTTVEGNGLNKTGPANSVKVINKGKVHTNNSKVTTTMKGKNGSFMEFDF